MFNSAEKRSLFFKSLRLLEPASCGDFGDSMNFVLWYKLCFATLPLNQIKRKTPANPTSVLAHDYKAVLIRKNPITKAVIIFSSSF